ncbi:MAG: 2-hydroxyacyl-CoA dehydratase [Candidatus Delongbacteria bacterium]|nr:2-hydroxyacyl-CoA dehydratase [Candidatus Delongbacteria bacterium]MBN2834930.1 2-hydroxyacyl-CoA dehydratase [Candidatus Delongbacteria bacterium]
MWSSLGLNLEAHEGLLNFLGGAYKDIYLSQKNRPKGMEYFDFVISEVHGLRIKELMDAKEEGRKIIGTFCVYVPEELILAVNGISVGLCAGAEVGTQEAEKYLPRNTCALIKGFVGFKLASLCPYVEATDLIVGETTCDGKKKAYEIFDEITGGKLYVMEIPNRKGDEGRKLWRSEIERFKEKLEEFTGIKITEENLSKSVKIVNEKRKALQRLATLRATKPTPISGLDALLINQISFYDDPVRFTDMLNKLCDELDERVKNGNGVFSKDTPRILVSGSPMAIPNWKLPFIIETSGAVIVGEEACVGERNFRNLTEENMGVKETLDNIASRYMGIDCACFTPNDERMTNISDMVDKYKADGVIHYSLQFCTPFTVESYKVKKTMDKKEVPFMALETDYSMEDFGQFKTRVEAFVEMIK